MREASLLALYILVVPYWVHRKTMASHGFCDPGLHSAVGGISLLYKWYPLGYLLSALLRNPAAV